MQSAFNFVIPSVQIARKSEKFVKKLTLYMNVVYDDNIIIYHIHVYIISVNLCCKIDL